MGKITRVLEKSGYTLDQQEQSSFADNEKEPTLPKRREPVVPQKSENSRPTGESTSNRVSRPKPFVSSEGWDERLTKSTMVANRVAEDFRVLRAKILLSQDGRPAPKSIMVTSALPSEGKSFIAANLGIALAHGVDQHSLMVDCDLRFPSLGQLFGIQSERGLADYLQNSTDLSSLIQKTSVDKLSILPSGVPPINPAELLGSARMHELIEELSLRYPDRFVIFDSPPLQVASESIVLSQVVDGVVLVVRQGVSGQSLIEKFITEIGKDKIIGVIFNGYKSNVITSRLVNKSHYYNGSYYGKQAD